MPDPTPKKKERNRKQFEIPEPLDRRLEAYSERTGLGQSEIIREAVRRYLNAEEKETE